MTRNIDTFVAENRDRIRDVDSRFVEVDSERDRDLSFGPTTISVGVDAVIHTRTTGSQVVFGHADDSKGFGRGTFGDDKGSWELAADPGDAAVVFTRRGRRAVVRALDGKEGAVTTSKAGVGTDDPVTSDEELTGVYSVTKAYTGKPDNNEVRASGVHDSTSWVGDVVEVGIFDGEDRLLARVVVDTDAGIGPTDDVRADVILTFEASGVGDTVFTEDGEAAVADAVAFPLEKTGPVEFRFGSANEDFSKTDTGLNDFEFSKACERIIDRSRITARTHVFESEPDKQPVDVGEIGVFDDDGRMIWATAVRDFEKTDSFGFNAESDFRVS